MSTDDNDFYAACFYRGTWDVCVPIGGYNVKATLFDLNPTRSEIIMKVYGDDSSHNYLRRVGFPTLSLAQDRSVRNF